MIKEISRTVITSARNKHGDSEIKERIAFQLAIKIAEEILNEAEIESKKAPDFETSEHLIHRGSIYIGNRNDLREFIRHIKNSPHEFII